MFFAVCYINWNKISSLLALQYVCTVIQLACAQHCATFWLCLQRMLLCFCRCLAVCWTDYLQQCNMLLQQCSCMLCVMWITHQDFIEVDIFFSWSSNHVLVAGHHELSTGQALLLSYAAAVICLNDVIMLDGCHVGAAVIAVSLLC